VIILSLSIGILGLLRYNDSTGYDLAKLFKESIGTLWRAQHSQIHRELNIMEEKGWVASHVVVQEGKPNKRVFAITDKGEEAFCNLLHEPAGLHQNYNSPLLIKILFGAAAPEEILRTLKCELDARISTLPSHIQKYKELFGKYKATFKNGEKEDFFWQMAFDYGIAQAEMMIKWEQTCIEKLEKELAKSR